MTAELRGNNMSNEGIVMSDRDFDQWFAKEFPEVDLSNSEICKGYNNMKYGWENALEHCKQGEPICSLCNGAGQLQMTNAGPDSEFSECHECDGTGKSNIQPLFAHAMPKSEGKSTLDKMREALEAVNGMFWVDKSTKHEIYESAHYPGQNQFTKESLGKHVFQLLRELDGETFESNILSTPQPTTDISELVSKLESLKSHKAVDLIDDVDQEVILMSDLRALIAKHTVKA